MKVFVVAAVLVSVASALSIQGKEELVKKFGAMNINFDKNVRWEISGIVFFYPNWIFRTNFCNQCHEITVTSTGGTAEHQPQRLGK